MRKHECMWCGHRLREHYMRMWDGRWECAATRSCLERAEVRRAIRAQEQQQALSEEHLRAAAAQLAEALREYAEIYPTKSRDYGRGFAFARQLIEEIAQPPATSVQRSVT